MLSKFWIFIYRTLANKDALVLLKKSLNGNIGDISSGTRSPPQADGNAQGTEIVNYDEIINRPEADTKTEDNLTKPNYH